MGRAEVRELPLEVRLDTEVLVTLLREFPGTVLLDSGNGEAGSDFSILGVGGRPRVTWSADGVDPQTDPFQLLRSALDEHHLDSNERWPFVGGLIGYVGYEARRLLEVLPSRHPRLGALPDMLWLQYALVLAVNHRTGEASVLDSSSCLTGSERRRVEHLRDALCSRLAARSGEEPPNRDEPWLPFAPQEVVPTSRPDHEHAIRVAKEHIALGDIYQVNLARVWRAPKRGDMLSLYRRLRRINPAAFGFFLEYAGEAILSVSPERFLRVRGRVVETVPIKGTAPRAIDPDLDRQHAAELVRSPKDAAELSMIVDILRNDLSRVCEPGSVRVVNHRELSSHATVHHLSSLIRGDLKPQCDVVDLLRATFPGGSITGAPRIRAMEIIDDLEPARRGPYCGSCGYLGWDGRADLNIMIRTVWTAADEIRFQGGGGIVADSDAAAEVRETEAKVAGILRALRGDEVDL